jgi:glutaminase
MADNPSLKEILTKAVSLAQNDFSGTKATYIPQLADVCAEITNAAVILCDGETIEHGTDLKQPLSLQSTAKLIVLIGMLEERGPNQVRSWVRFEPSGNDFASIARLDQFGPLPSNPMLNAGAISLCSQIRGDMAERLAWIHRWAEKLLGKPADIDDAVFQSELRTGDRNRSIAYLLRSTGVVTGDIEELMEVYFSLCSLEASTTTSAMLPMILANDGINHLGERIMSRETARIVTSVMATCGLYNESGTHLVNTGLPAKSGVSGLILAIAPGKAGIAVASPRVNSKGNSIRGGIMLEYISRKMGWHFLEI